VALLEVENLKTYFFTREGAVQAVDGVSFTVEEGRTLGIVGESGCGKSVTALSIMGLIPKPPAKIVEGSVVFEGRDLTKLAEHELEDVRGKDIAMIFQDPMTSLNPTFKIGRQITETLERHFDMSKGAARQRAIELLEEVGIPGAAERLDDYPHQFSGGMRQRVMIAIALSCDPKLLIADEPTTALDVTIQAQILDLLEGLRGEHRMAMIIITHDMGVIAEAADDVAVMQLEGEGIREGRLTAIGGRPPDLVNPPEGCRFAPRCPYEGQDSCATRPQELRQIRPGHWVRSAHPTSERGRARETVTR
jgi:ABC-type dipeptide/oligopeptide/nickel transport system ATPase component